MRLSTRKKRFRLISIGETGDLAVEAVHDTLHHNLAEVEAKALISFVTLKEMARNRVRDI